MTCRADAGWRSVIPSLYLKCLGVKVRQLRILEAYREQLIMRRFSFMRCCNESTTV